LWQAVAVEQALLAPAVEQAVAVLLTPVVELVGMALVAV